MSQQIAPEVSARIRAAIAQAPAKMALQMARDLGVPEVEVVRRLPDERAVELDRSRWEEIFTDLAAMGKVHVLVTNSMATLETVGEFGNFSTWGEFFNVQTDSLDMHIRFGQFSAIFAIEKPSHMSGLNTLSFQFFDLEGHAGFKVFLTFGSTAPAPATYERFRNMRSKYRLAAPENDA